MVQLSWNIVSPGTRNKVFTQLIVKPDVVAGLAAVLATGMDKVVMDLVLEEEDVPVILLMVLTYRTPIEILRHKNGRP
jgi:D-alanine-D-alanine ligase-like ATP-grasp enzyme